jgi:uncharacterized protein YjbJ (UPF0337 family)
MSDHQHDNRSVAEIEADVERTRASVSNTLEQLRGSLSPGQIMDQVVDYARSSGGAEFTRNLGASVRDNPLPLLLVGAGIGWMMLSNQNRGQTTVHREVYPGRTPLLPYDNAAQRPYGVAGQHGSSSSGPSTTERVSNAASGAAGTVGDAASNAAGAVSGAVSSAGSAIRSAADSVRDAVSGAASSASHQASQFGRHASTAGDAMRARSHDMRDMASQGMDRAYGQANYLSGQMRDSWDRAGPAQPLIIGGMGLLLGAALGAMLPRTRTEDRLMGEASDAVRHQVTETAQHHYEEAKSVVTERAGEAADALKQDGRATGLVDAAKDAVQGVASVAVKTTQDLGQVAKSSVEDKSAEKSTDTAAEKPAGSATDKPADKPEPQPARVAGLGPTTTPGGIRH